MLLSIDTCGSLGSIALAQLAGDQLQILGETELPGKTYSARLIAAIRELLGNHRVKAADLSAIVVTTGPGSFTGIRIGLSAAKGLAEIDATPLVAVSRLAVLAHKAGAGAAGLDAGRGEFYFGQYAAAPTGEFLLTQAQFQEEAAAAGAGVGICEETVQAFAPGAVLVSRPTAVDALHFALPRLRAGDWDDPVTLDGNYLRRSDAEIFSRPKLVGAEER